MTPYTIIPFPGARRFAVVAGCIMEATGFGPRPLAEDRAVALLHDLAIRAERYDRDGARAMARLYRAQVGQLTAALVVIADKKRASGRTGRSFSGEDGGRYRD